MRHRLPLSTLALTAALVVGLAGVAAAGTRNATVTSAGGTQYVNIRSAPTTSSTYLGRINSGSRVGLQCSVTGQAVKGPYGTSTIWYRIDGSTPTAPRYVTDALLETGSNSSITPSCGPSGMRLPFPSGSTHRITQGPGGATSHGDAYNLSAVDWAANSGESVVASAAGRVYFEGWNGAGGIMVLIQVGSTNQCVQYAHLSASIVDRGQTVARGQQIGRVGGSGYGRQNYYAPHLHWAGVSCSTQKSSFVINSAERGTSYPAGTSVKSTNSR